VQSQIVRYSRSLSYRQNKNGSIDSICLVCSRAAAKGLELAELKMIENDHNCEPEMLLN
jgi:hypothetical protein